MDAVCYSVMDWIQGVFPVNAGIRSNNDEDVTIPALVVFNLNDAPPSMRRTS